MKHEGYTPGIWRVEGRKDGEGRTMPHIDAVSYGIDAERIVIAENLFVRDAALIADAPHLAEENERLRALLARLYTICLQDSIRDANLSDDFDDALDESGAALARESE